MTSKAVVLLSGGLDSATVLAIAKRESDEVYAMSFDYGQRHRVELECAEAQLRLQGVSGSTVIKIDLRQFGGSALTAEMDVPKGRDETTMESDIPVTYVPARNTIFLSFALGWAEVLGASRIYVGVNALDYSGYPDCRPEFIAAFQSMADLSTKAGVQGNGPKICAPLINLTKAEIISRGLELGVDFSQTTSCYDPKPDGAPCQECDSCVLRQRGFSSLSMSDPRNTKHGLED